MRGIKTFALANGAASAKKTADRKLAPPATRQWSAQILGPDRKSRSRNGSKRLLAGRVYRSNGVSFECTNARAPDEVVHLADREASRARHLAGDVPYIPGALSRDAVTTAKFAENTRALGIAITLIRISVGIEAAEDILADEQAFRR